MSVHVQLDENDRKFMQSLKEFWIEAKKQFVWMLVAAVFGFGLGKLYTWDDIINDCKVVGAFRIAKTAVQCKVMVP